MYLSRNKYRLKKREKNKKKTGLGANLIFMTLNRDDTSNLLLMIIHLNYFIRLILRKKIFFIFIVANIFERGRKDVMTKGSRYITNYSSHVTGEKYFA